MRIYRFNPETGLYLGEDFADRASFKGRAFEIPEDATTIPPPKVTCLTGRTSPKSQTIMPFKQLPRKWRPIRLSA